jgi:hypothetical protein
VTFKTAASSVTAPSVATGSASSLTTTGATLSGTANPNGGATTAYFQWGTSTSYGSTTTSQSLGSGTSVANVSANLSGLSPNTTYNFRLVASNSAGTQYGSNVTFKTAAESGPPTIASAIPSPGTVRQGGATTLTYSVNSPGSGIQVLLGASIQLPGGAPVSDPSNDRKVILAPGVNTVTRTFIVPSATPKGVYNLLVSLVEDVNNNGRIDSGDRNLDSRTYAGVFTVAKFSIGDSVQVYNTASAGLVIRSAPCGSQLKPNKFDGATGVILEGPKFCESHNRWRIRWSDGREGWSAEGWLRRY